MHALRDVCRLGASISSFTEVVTPVSAVLRVTEQRLELFS
jgi:hypothetical protein